MDFTDNIGNNIKALRKEKHLSQQDLANKCGFSNTTLSAYENNKKKPGLYTVGLLAKGLEVTIDRLCYGDETISFIESVSNDGRKIVNCIYYLWQKDVLTYDESGSINTTRMSSYMNEEMIDSSIIVSNFYFPIRRLLMNLDEFSSKKATYPNPEQYLEMILSSVANEINEEIKRNAR